MNTGAEYLGRMLLITGLVLSLTGGLFLLAGKIPWLGRLPGDFMIQKKNFTLYLPLATSILVSILLTLLFRFMGRK
ncbi:MAG: DUF2905 domain-containing protein [Thermodesulfovibrio sp.]|nr:DUF2905 domain-containing protein [Thermodesulfovibrio sp.]